MARTSDENGRSEVRLSWVSKQFDIEHKGYLSPAEKKLRVLDVKNTGAITNETAIHIMEETIKLKHSNHSLHRWIWGLMITIIAVGAGTIAVTFWGASLAKDTSIDDSSGAMKVKGNKNKNVVTVGRGTIHYFPLSEQKDGRRGACVPVAELNEMFTEMSTGTTTNVGLTEDASREFSNDIPSTNFIGLKAAGSRSSRRGVCYATKDGSSLCYQFGDFCDDDQLDRNGVRRLSSEDAAALHRHHFHSYVRGIDLGLPARPDVVDNNSHLRHRSLKNLVAVPTILDFQIACDVFDSEGVLLPDASMGLLEFSLRDISNEDRGFSESFATAATLTENYPYLFDASVAQFQEMLFSVTMYCQTDSVAANPNAAASPDFAQSARCMIGARNPNYRNYVGFHAWTIDCSSGQNKISDKKVIIEQTISRIEKTLNDLRVLWTRSSGQFPGQD